MGISIATARPLRVSASVRLASPRTRASREVARMFGLPSGGRLHLYDNLQLSVGPGVILAVVGPSGAGKSVLLRRLTAKLKGACLLDVAGLAQCDLPAVDAVAGGPSQTPSDLAERLEILSRCGLAEAQALVTPARRLSGGQLYRLALARAMLSALRGGASTVIADEFGSVLDDQTAHVVCQQVRKLISGSGLSLIVATPRATLLEYLRPDVVVYKPVGEPARVERPVWQADQGQQRFVIQQGRLADYRMLEQFHYLSGPPALHKRVYVARPTDARHDASPSIAGVLIVSPPLACVAGRNAATEHRYQLATRRASLALLNAEVEAISRVVVHPVFRGCGVGTQLVRHALATSPMPTMEALAAMGAVHPLFEKAGMTNHGQFAGRRGKYTYYLGKNDGVNS